MGGRLYDHIFRSTFIESDKMADSADDDIFGGEGTTPRTTTPPVKRSAADNNV